MATRPDDTSQAAWQLQRQAVARLSPEARVRTAIELSEAVRAIQIEGILARTPGLSRRDAVRQLVRAQLNVELPESA